MPPFARRFRARNFLGSLLLSLTFNQADAGKVEDVTFQTNVVPKTTNSKPVRLQSRLYLPASGGWPYSAVVITPSSGGVRAEREVHYAEALADEGIAALVVDSFSSRGVSSSVHDQSALSAWQTGNDAVAALRWLIADGRFKPDRIAVAGVSKGGEVAMHTALHVRRRWMRMSDVAFAAHVAIVPGCNWVNRSTGTTGAPIFFMLAELDDQTGAAPCLEYAETLRKAGSRNIQIKVYKGAHHAWERLGPRPYFDPLAESYKSCQVLVEDNGAMVSAKDRQPIPRRAWHDWAKKNCMTLGSHCCGGTPALKREATDDMVAFLKRHGF